MNDSDARSQALGDAATERRQTDPDLVIPNVALGQRLGEGGMAIVYEGLDSGFTPPRRVAVKLMSPILSADPRFRARFEREASIVASFRHDNIVHIYGSGESRGAKYLVMEYLPGGTLGDRLCQGIPTPTAIEIAAILANALAFSHERGVIHRDFKPGNVLFTADDKPVLTDFGIAKDMQSPDSQLTGHEILGAPRYMAPEQARGEPLTTATDVYSWGLTLVELLTGTVPPLSDRLTSVAYDPVRAGVPPRISDLILRCLQMDSNARPTASDCERELWSIAQSSSSVAPPGSAQEPGRSKRRRYAAAAAITLVAVTGLLTMLWLDRRGQSLPQATAAETPVDQPVVETLEDQNLNQQTFLGAEMTELTPDRQREVCMQLESRLSEFDCDAQRLCFRLRADSDQAFAQRLKPVDPATAEIIEFKGSLNARLSTAACETLAASRQEAEAEFKLRYPAAPF